MYGFFFFPLTPGSFGRCPKNVNVIYMCMYVFVHIYRYRGLYVLCSTNFLSCDNSNSVDATNDLSNDQVKNIIDLKGHEISSNLFSVSPSLMLPRVILLLGKQNKTSTKPQKPCFTI